MNDKFEEAFIKVPMLCKATQHWIERDGYAYAEPAKSSGFCEDTSIADMWIYAWTILETRQVQRAFAP